MASTEQIASLKLENADLKGEKASLKRALDAREVDNKAERARVNALQNELDELFRGFGWLW